MNYGRENKWNMPFFMLDLDNAQLITVATIPEGEIKDTKNIVITETPIPGLNYQPITSGGGGNRKISFTLPLVQRNDVYGNLLMLKQFDRLRNNTSGTFSGGFQFLSGAMISPNPQVIFYWGTGSMPLVWYVTKCDFSHRADMINAAGYPQHTMVDIELTLDEENVLYQIEEGFRMAAATLGNSNAIFNFQSERRGVSLFGGDF